MAAKKSGNKPTDYMVLRGPTPLGPYEVVGPQTAQGQLAAKRAAVLQDTEGDSDLETAKLFYLAIPASSFAPQKPTVQVTITFTTEAGGVDEEPEEEETEEEEEEADVVQEPESEPEPPEAAPELPDPSEPSEPAETTLSRVFDEDA